MTPSRNAASAAPWRQAGPLFGLLLVGLLWLFRDTGAAMVTIWLRSDTFAHGMLVAPITLWLVWRQREVLAALRPEPAYWAWALLALAGLGWLLGDLVAVNALTQLALVSMIVLLVPAVLGLPVARAIAFPMAFLFFAVPFGEFAMPKLMAWTADFTVLAVRLSGIPVYREGLQFVIPSGQWSVVEACSGVRYLIASLTVGTLFAYLNYQSLGRRALFILVSILVPIVANWLRAYMIVMLGHFSGNTLAVGVDHLIYGWVFFGVVIVLMFWVGARWSEPEPSAAALAASASGVAGSRATPWALSGVVLAALLGAPVSARWAIEHSGSTEAVALQAPAQLAPGWQALPRALADWQPAFQNPSAQFNTSYGQGEAAVGLYVGYYRQQNYTRKLVSSENMLVTSQDAQWSQVRSATRPVVLDAQPVTVRTAELRANADLAQAQSQRLLVWQVYWVNGTWTASDTLAKVWGAWYRLIGRGDESAVLLAYALKGPDGAGEAALSRFVQDNGAELARLLQATRQSSRP